MRSSTAFVLATLAVGQAAAGHLKHASFHARRSNAPQDKVEIDVGKRNAKPIDYDVSDVDWTKALENVDWSKVNYGASSSPAPAPVASSSAVVVVPSSSAVAIVAAEATPTPSSTPASSSSAAPSSSSAAAASATATKSSTSLTGAILEAVDEAKLLALGFAGAATNPTSTSGNAYVNGDGPYIAELSNTSGEDVIFVCWEGASSWVNKFVPLISITVPSGGAQSVSFSDAFSGACAGVYSDTDLVNGQISNTWLELTTGSWGTYDVSKEVNMSGHGISAVGPTCTADMTTCVFECSSGNSCEYGYVLKNCASGAVGTASDGGASGGCQGLGSGATLKVTLS